MQTMPGFAARARRSGWGNTRSAKATHTKQRGPTVFFVTCDNEVELSCAMCTCLLAVQSVPLHS
jgi:hypothetical protein